LPWPGNAITDGPGAPDTAHALSENVAVKASGSTARCMVEFPVAGSLGRLNVAATGRVFITDTNAGQG
jgi:hypothetical protein